MVIVGPSLHAVCLLSGRSCDTKRRLSYEASLDSDPRIMGLSGVCRRTTSWLEVRAVCHVLVFVWEEIASLWGGR